jgi:predicted ATPase
MESLPAQLAQLENAQLVRRLNEEELAYLFKHALTQESAYESLLRKKRREIHLRVVQAYEQLYPDRLDEYAALLAQHYTEAGDDEKATTYLIRAGDQAARVYAHSEARVHYALALDALSRLPDNDENRRQRVDALIKQVSVSLRAAGPQQSLERMQQAETLLESLGGDPADRARLARIHYWMGHA